MKGHIMWKAVNALVMLVVVVVAGVMELFELKSTFNWMKDIFK